MTRLNHQNFTPQLQHLMQLEGISTFKQLSQKAGISDKQVMRLRRGELSQMRLETLQKLSQALGTTLGDLLAAFKPEDASPSAHSSAIELQQEYQRLQRQLAQQQQDLWQEFQQASLQTLEPWLLQWSAAAYAAQQNPQLPAAKLLPLTRPIEQLLQEWNVEAIAPVGAEIPFDPYQHQLMGGSAEPGNRVRVRYAGYRQGDRLLHRAKVSPI